VERRIYPFVLVVTAVGFIVTFQIRQFKKLYEHIKNDKYEFDLIIILLWSHKTLNYFFSLGTLLGDV